MNHESVRQALGHFDRLPEEERRLIEALAVHDWFGAEVIEYTSEALGLGVATERITGSPFVAEDQVPHFGPDQAVPYVIRPFLRSALVDRLRTERPEAYRQAHELAAAHFHQSLEPLRTDRLERYIKEVRHLAAARPEKAFVRLSSFAHSALMEGCSEAAGRAATAAVDTAVSPSFDEVSLTRIIKAVAEILNAPAHVEHASVMELDDVISQYRLPTDPAASRILLLARDLVTYYTERLAPVVPLTAMVVPDAVTTVDPRGLPTLWNELRMLQDLAQIAGTITSRTHRMEFVERDSAHHRVSTKVSALVAAGSQPQPRVPVIVDLLRWDADRFLDGLHLSERNGRTLNMLTSTDVKLQIARGVYRLMDSDDSRAEPTSQGEIARQLHALAWSNETDEITSVLQRAAETDALEPDLRRRIGGLIQYMPLVALIDAHPGMSSEVTYEFDKGCRTERIGWGQVKVSVGLSFPPEVRRNRLEVVTPDGLDPVGRPEVRGGVHLRAESADDDLDGVQEFTLYAGTRDDENDWTTGDRIADAQLELRYVSPRKDFRNVLRTSGFCLLVSLTALFLPFVLDPSLWSQVASVVASALLVVDSSRGIRRDTDGHGESLRTYANKPLRVVRITNVVAAIVAATSANTNVVLGQSLAGGSFLVCTVSFAAVWRAATQRRRLLPDETQRHRRRVLIG